VTAMGLTEGLSPWVVDPPAVLPPGCAEVSPATAGAPGPGRPAVETGSADGPGSLFRPAGFGGVCATRRLEESDAWSACEVREPVPAAVTRLGDPESAADSVRGREPGELKAPPRRPLGESVRDSRVRVEGEAWVPAVLDSDDVPAEECVDPVSSESACAVFAVAKAVPMPRATANAPILPMYELAFRKFGACP
jgi:hypothetical protein